MADAVAVSDAEGEMVRAAEGEEEGVAACVPLALGDAGVEGEAAGERDALAPRVRLAVAVPEAEAVFVLEGSSLPPAPTE